MGVFDGASKAEIPGNGQWFQPGRYVVEIKKCIHKLGKAQGGSGYRGESYIIETQILWADSDHENAPAVGSKATQVVKADSVMAQANVMQFMCALYPNKDGKPSTPASKSDAQWAKLGGKVFIDSRDRETESAAEGQVLEVECFLKDTTSPTAKAKHFTVHNWMPISDERLEELGL